ncbi:MAG: SGNH/GDSL hydrolase family protein, partial [Planctomycetota bacterium]
ESHGPYDVIIHNAGVGGDIFNVNNLADPIIQSPRQITVAYGINDFHHGRDATPADSYLQRLRELYPDIPVTVLEPIWAAREGLDHHPQPNESGITLPRYRQQLRDIVADFDSMRCVASNQLLPDLDSFVPDGIHPSTVGHQVMGQNLHKILSRETP